YGEYHPVAPNDTPQNKRRNRRVEIVILPPTLMKPVNR
ncbi:MAG: flagellar motor protein MotB, partial [Candidatus Omnitrophica bacterium]|nr:flagellar motor protein MotB [Candidatus Omnitrophota bacterium]